MSQEIGATTSPCKKILTCIKCKDELLDRFDASDCDDEDLYLACNKCEIYYTLCSDCHQFCQFLGHEGFFMDEKTKDKLKLRPSKILNSEEIKDLYEDLEGIDIDLSFIETGYSVDDDFIPYCVSDKNLFYFDTTGILPTGPDGGMCHFWKCLNCKKVFILTDK